MFAIAYTQAYNFAYTPLGETEMQRIIGLTGGISTGKSTVSRYLSQRYQLPILDADIYAREAVQQNSPILRKIHRRYGDQILLADRSLNRGRLGEIVFSNPNERQWLESQVHPFVRDRFKVEINALDAEENACIVFVVPLLFEAGLTNLVTEIWVVYASPQQQLERLMQRDRLTEEQALNRINSQMSIQKKCDRASIVLDNSSTIEALLQQVDVALNNFEC